MGKKKKKGDAPAHLSADARQMWRDIIAEYDGWGIAELSVLCSALVAGDRMCALYPASRAPALSPTRAA
jgi:hypothetical protein